MATAKNTTGVIEGVLVYAKLAEPSLKYQSKDTEYSVGILVNEDAADAWEESFKKQPAKKFKTSEFEEKFKFALPDQFKGEKNVYQITLKKDATKDGEEFQPQYRPRVFVDMSAGERVDITESRLVANGSVGKVSYRINSNDFGTFARLQNVLMSEDNFIEYVSAGGKAGSEFGDKPVTTEAPKESATKARANKAQAEEETKPKASKPKAAPAPQDDEMSAAPF